MPKPVETGNDELAEKFKSYLKYGPNLTLLPITETIGETAGVLRGNILAYELSLAPAATLFSAQPAAFFGAPLAEEAVLAVAHGGAEVAVGYGFHRWALE